MFTWNANPFHLISHSSGINEMDALSRKMQYALVEFGGMNSPLAKIRGRQNTTVNTQVQAMTVLEKGRNMSFSTKVYTHSHALVP